jgi:hypothetical protein
MGRDLRSACMRAVSAGPEQIAATRPDAEQHAEGRCAPCMHRPLRATYESLLQPNTGCSGNYAATA